MVAPPLLDLSPDFPLHICIDVDPGFRVGLVGALDDFETWLGDLPTRASITRQIDGRFDRIVWFTASRLDLQANAEEFSEMLSETGGRFDRMIWFATSRADLRSEEGGVRNMGRLAECALRPSDRSGRERRQRSRSRGAHGRVQDRRH